MSILAVTASDGGVMVDDVDVVEKRGHCTICYNLVLSNEPRGKDPSGYFHDTCILQEGTCYICENPVYNTELYGDNITGRYHVACIGEYKGSCYICMVNVYSTQAYGLNKNSKQIYHSQCIETVKEKCKICDENIFWKTRRIRRENCDLVHYECEVIEINKARVNKALLQTVGYCAICKKGIFKDEFREKNDDGEYMQNSCLTIPNATIIIDDDKMVLLPQRINVQSRAMVPLFASQVVQRINVQSRAMVPLFAGPVASRVQKNRPVQKKTNRNDCPYCKGKILEMQERAKTQQGKCYHIACHKKTRLRVEIGIAKPLLIIKLNASKHQHTPVTKPLIPTDSVQTVADMEEIITQMKKQSAEAHEELRLVQKSLASHNASNVTVLATSALLAKKTATHEEELAASTLAIAGKDTELVELHAQITQARDKHVQEDLRSEHYLSSNTLQHEHSRLELKKSQKQLAECTQVLSDRKTELSNIDKQNMIKQEMIKAKVEEDSLEDIAQKHKVLGEMDTVLQQIYIYTAKT